MSCYYNKRSWQQLIATQSTEIAFIIFEAATFFECND